MAQGEEVEAVPLSSAVRQSAGPSSSLNGTWSEPAILFYLRLPGRSQSQCWSATAFASLSPPAKVSLEGLGTYQFLGKYVPGVSTSRL